ncbi:MAG: hypothetical protein H7258_08160, partial [Ferruginibacter sp.]|nr:hypothetical protein [Ferruginibacter sp.]
GSSELSTINFYRQIKLVEAGSLWNEHHKQVLCDVSGFFPFTQPNMDQFCKTYLEFIKNIDVLGVWRVGEENVADLFNEHIQLINLPAIEPYYFATPWSSALKGKKVLVISPFTESIKKQYEKRTLLFANKEMLPDFELLTITAVQTVAENTEGFTDWFEALESMYAQIAKMEFDVAIIGAGAYGMPLANFIKMKMGKIAIHMGGATQLLFGIKGKRWDSFPSIKAMYNEHWINPSEAERPAGLDKVEGGSYW